MKKYASAIILSTVISSAAVCFAKYSAGLYKSMFFMSPAGDLASKAFMSILLGCALSLVGCVLYFKKLQAAYSVFIYALTFVLTVINVFCILHLHMFMSWNVIDIILCTNPAEASGFLKGHVGFNDITIAVCASVFAVLIWRGKDTLTSLFVKYKKAAGALILSLAVVAYMLLGSVVGTRNSSSVPIYAFYKSLESYIEHRRSLLDLNPNRPNNVKIVEQASDLPELVCFIIGESENRQYMGIYGTDYDSTPLMQKQQEANNLFVFNDVISPQGTTSAVMPRLLSFMNNETANENVSKFDTIIDVVSKCGYQTFWLTNQGFLSANYVYFCRKCCNYSFSSFNDGAIIEAKDSALLPEFDKFLQKEVKKSNNNFFVFHLYGSHFRYDDRYPKEFNKFKASNIVQERFNEHKKKIAAEYLNSILFTDYLLNEIINRIKDKDAVMVYISDHGEELWLPTGLFGHRLVDLSKPVVEIPMFIYASEKYKKKRPQIISSIKAALNRPYMTDNLIHTVCDLIGVKTNAYDSAKSVINANFTPQERIIDGMNYKSFR